MSVIGVLVNDTAVKRVTSICYDNNLVTSQGVFLGDNPLMFSLPTFLLEMTIIFLGSNMVHYLLERLGQPKFVSNIVTGILLGPSVFGRNSSLSNAVFPSRGMFILDTCSLLGLILFLFGTGAKTDISILRRARKRDFAIALSSTFVPFLAVFATLLFMNSGSVAAIFEETGILLNVGQRLSLSSFPVISASLEDMALLNSDLGRVVATASLIADIMGWFTNAVIITWKLSVTVRTTGVALATLTAMIAFVLFVTFVVRPLALRMVRKVPPGELLGEGFFLVLLLAALWAALTTEVVGYHPVVGPLLIGTVLPGGMPVGVTVAERLQWIHGLFLPLLLVLAGCRTVLQNIKSWASWGIFELIFIICYVGKLVGTVGAAVFFDTPWRDAVTMGFMLNIRGVVEVWNFNTMGDSEMASSSNFSIIITCLLLHTSITHPIVKLLYDPTVHYVATKRRTVQHVKPQSPLRVLACVHNDDQVAPFIDLFEALYPSAHSPLSLHLLHLNELVGRVASVLRPYKNRQNPSADPSLSDRIVNAFRYYEQQHPCGAVSLHPFVAISPISAMHNDVCSIALARKCHLVVLPFHKQSDGARETARTSFQYLNRQVLSFAPCSVAILVDRGGSIACAQTNHLLQHAVVYFLGGADDREALAIAMRMVEGEVALTVVRFRSRDEEVEVDEQDEEAIEQCVRRCGEGVAEGVVYMEKTVVDGEGTVAVMMGMNEKFDIVIVGRRKGMESALTSGLSAWSECPELGTLGDTLAAADLGVKVSILVVQQQERLGQSGGGGGRCSSGKFPMIGRR